LEKVLVLIVDKQAIFRAGVRQALSQRPEFELLDCEPDQDLLRLIEDKSPDIVLLDIDYPSLSGLVTARKIALTFPNTKVVVLTPSADDEQLFESIKTAAAAYLSKGTTTDELANTIHRVSKGEYPVNESLFIRPRVAEQVLKQFQSMLSMGEVVKNVIAPLTARETQILGYIAEGKSNKQIAFALQISEQTIKNHVSAILRKLNANDRAHAAVLAIRHGLLSADGKPLPNQYSE